MRTPEVRPYWEILNKKRCQLVLKRGFDFIVALILFIILSIPMAVISLMIKLEDPGPVLYRQERVTTYGRHFKIHKFRTMVVNADKMLSAMAVVINFYFILRYGLKIWSLASIPTLVFILGTGSRKAFIIVILGVFLLYVLNDTSKKSSTYILLY